MTTKTPATILETALTTKRAWRMYQRLDGKKFPALKLKLATTLWSDCSSTAPPSSLCEEVMGVLNKDPHLTEAYVQRAAEVIFDAEWLDATSDDER